MAKRKRIEESKIEATFSRCQTDLFKVLKSAKAFERQRLAKRLKDRSTTTQKAERLNKELLILNSLDLSKTADAHLISSLLKIPQVAQSPDLPDLVKQGVPKLDMPEEERHSLHNVTSSLYNRKQVRDVHGKCVSMLSAALGVAEKRPDAFKASVDRKPQSEDEPSEPSEIGEQDDGNSEDGNLDDELPSDVEGSIDEEMAEAALAKFDARLATPSDKDESDINSEEENLDTPRVSKRKDKASATSGSLPKTTFLPTLMGGYISGSESASDIDDAPPRKNRRGQRARQKIWEKRYGESAKHVQKVSRDAGWDPKRGAVDPSSQKKLQHKEGRKSRAAFAPNQKHKTEPADRRKEILVTGRAKDDGPLHPSWEAAKKAKEKPTPAYQGKKIVFD
jgi:hypothetical protein